ncbi:transposase, partial [Vibrio fluvialis]|nr:transposase [Vibrio fluvialis]
MSYIFDRRCDNTLLNNDNAEHYYDGYFQVRDTTNRILDKVPIEKPQRNGTKTRERSGVYSSGLVAG